LDNNDLKGLYKVLLEELVPTYYDDRPKWVEMMKASILCTEDQFAVKRMFDEYYNLLYIET